MKKFYDDKFIDFIILDVAISMIEIISINPIVPFHTVDYERT